VKYWFHRSLRVALAALVGITFSGFFRYADAAPYDAGLGTTIDTYLSGLSSPIAGNGNVFFSQGVQWNVDPRLVVAISGQEQNFGRAQTSCTSVFNAWSWFYYGLRCPDASFSSWAEGIQTVTKYLRKTYFDRYGLTTIEGIGAIYCSEACGDWAKNVRIFYAERLSGDTADLTFTKPEVGPAGPILVATGFPNITSIATNGDHVYFGTIDGRLFRVPKNATQPILATDLPPIATVPGFIGQVLFHGENIWFYGQAGPFATASIYVMPRDLSAGPRPFLTGVVKSMGIHESNMYYWDGDGAVRSIPLSGGPPELLLAPSWVFGFAMDGATIFMQANSHAVSRLDTVTRTLTTVIPQQTENSTVVVDTTSVYVGGPGLVGPGFIYKAPKAGGAAAVPLVDAPLAPGTYRGVLLSDSSRVYYVEGPGGVAVADTLKSIPVGGGTPSNVTEERVSIRFMIKVDGVLYWCTTATFGASIYRLN